MYSVHVQFQKKNGHKTSKRYTVNTSHVIHKHGIAKNAPQVKFFSFIGERNLLEENTNW